MGSSGIDTARLRNALGSFATGVTIVTTRDADGVDRGVTANSFTSVSLEPPLVLWSLGKRSSSLEAFMRAEYFAVNVLAEGQEPLSDRFSSRGVDRVAGLEIVRGRQGLALLNGCASQFECRVHRRHEGGDHWIFVGEVECFRNFERLPLLFHGGRYRALRLRFEEAGLATG